jgi:hypothetical protein
MKKLKCVHCGHRIEAPSWNEADRAMVEHYAAVHPDRKYAEEIDLQTDEAIRDGRLSFEDAQRAALVRDRLSGKPS